MIRVIESALVYFIVVFSVAFVFGIIRTMFVVPHIGERWSELIEMPFLFLVIIFAARWIVRRFDLFDNIQNGILVGLIASSILLIVEFTVVLGIRGVSLGEFFAQRDAIAGTAYCIMVLIFAAAPAYFARVSV